MHIDIYMHVCAQNKKSLGTPHESKAMRNELKGIHTYKKPVETRKKESPSALQDTPASCSLFRDAAFLVLCTLIRYPRALLRSRIAMQHNSAFSFLSV